MVKIAKESYIVKDATVKLPGRNDPCHCGSGNKYKKCCLQKNEEKSKLDNLAQQEPVSQEELLPVFESQTQESSSEQQVLPLENENVTKLWDELKKLNYPDDTSKSLAIIESFIRDFPHLANESDIIDEMFVLEEHLYYQNRIGEYITLLENIGLFAPEFYLAKAGWFNLSRLRYTVAIRQTKKIESLLGDFKKNPGRNAYNLSETIEFLAWTGANNELLELVKATYKTLTDSDEIWNPDYVNEWMYFDNYYPTSMSSMSVDEKSLRANRFG
jgi:hypothetical protein